MNCLDMEQLFDAYLDHQMSSSLRLEFDAHRLRCPVCQQKLAMLEACEQAIVGDRRQPELPPDFTQSVMARLASRRASGVRRPRRGLWIAAAALQAAAVIVFAVFWFRPAPAPTVELARGEDARLNEILRESDAVELYRYINARVDTLRAARATLSDDVGGLAQMALNLGVPEEVSAFDTLSPLEQILRTLIPGPPQENDAEGAASDVYSL
jgi:hypothetical protein